MTRTKRSESKDDFAISATVPMRRVFFNRFKCGRVGDALCVRVWFQDEMMRICNAYAFVMSIEDLKSCRANVEQYLMKSLEGAQDPMDAPSESYPVEIQDMDTFRMMTCTRIEDRAEIYLSYLPLAHLVAPTQGCKCCARAEACLISNLSCHLALLRTILDEK